MAAVSAGPLNYINGHRVESTNNDTADDISVFEPATGQQSKHAVSHIHIFTRKTPNAQCFNGTVAAVTVLTPGERIDSIAVSGAFCNVQC